MLNDIELQNSEEYDVPVISIDRFSSKDNSSIAVSRNSSLLITSNSTNMNEHRYNHPNFTFDFPLCLVHVGKTAGSSISCGLGLMYANCEGMPRQPPIPNVDYFHMRKNNCLYKNDEEKHVATLLMTIRNPLTRIRSWFNFEKDILPTRRNKQTEERLRWKRRMLFIDCYDNFADLVIDGLELSPSATTTNNNNVYEITSERPINMTCKERAWAAVLGVRDFSYHEWYNYEHYWTALQALYLGNNEKPSSGMKPSLLVLRTEHLSDDWYKLSKENLFRHVNKGNPIPPTVDDLPFTNASGFSNSKPYNSTKLDDDFLVDDHSSRFWFNLCNAMCPEIQIYEQILQHASNLKKLQVEESIREIQVMCPLNYNTPERSCPGIPKFPLLKVSRRQYLTETKKRLFVII